MLAVTFSKYPFRLREPEEIFDIVRKKWVARTPEEWVRQHWIHFLIEQKYPASLIAIEHSIKLFDLGKRCDIVIFSKKGNPVLIIECKSNEVKLSQKTMEQIGRYNLKLQVPHLIISNGTEHYGFRIDHEKKSWKEISELPLFTDL